MEEERKRFIEQKKEVNIDELQRKISESQRKIDELTRSEQELKAKAQELQERSQEKTRENEKLKKELENAIGERIKVERISETISKEFISYKKSVSQSQQQSQTTASQKAIDTKLQALHQENDSLKTEILKYNGKKSSPSTTTTTTATINDSNKVLEEKIALLLKGNEELKQEIANKSEQASQFETSIGVLLTEKADLAQRNALLRKEIDKYKSALSNVHIPAVNPQISFSPTPENALQQTASSPKPPRPRQKMKKEAEKTVDDEDIPPAIATTNKPVVMFSGYKTESQRVALSEFLVRLGCEVINEEFSPRVTHVIVPSFTTKTMKVIAAAITSKWVMHDSWVTDSFERKKLLPEFNYGSKRVSSPIALKNIFLSEGFKKDNIRTKNAVVLFKLGNATQTENQEAADMILMDDKELPQQKQQQQSIGKVFMNWQQFIENLVLPLPAMTSTPSLSTPDKKRKRDEQQNEKHDKKRSKK